MIRSTDAKQQMSKPETSPIATELQSEIHPSAEPVLGLSITAVAEHLKTISPVGCVSRAHSSTIADVLRQLKFRVTHTSREPFCVFLFRTALLCNVVRKPLFVCLGIHPSVQETKNENMFVNNINLLLLLYLIIHTITSSFMFAVTILIGKRLKLFSSFYCKIETGGYNENTQSI